MQRADAAIRRGDWESAASQFAQAINHPDLPRDAITRSAMHLGYGRALGVLCHFDEAEKYLLRAKDIAASDDKAGSATIDALRELGAINVARKKYAAAIEYYLPFVAAIEREPRTKLPPWQTTDAFEKLAIALAATGKPDEADARRREAGKWRGGVPGALPAGAITPYGTQCPKA